MYSAFFQVKELHLEERIKYSGQWEKLDDHAIIREATIIKEHHLHTVNSVIINFDDEDDDDEDVTTQPDEGTAEAEPSEAGAQSSNKVNESDDGPVRFPILPPELLPVDFEYPADAILIEPDEQMDELAHDVSILSCSEIDVTGCSSDLIMEE